MATQAQKTNKMKIKKGDSVIVLTGKNKGQKGEVLEAIPANSRVNVKGVNVVKKHQKPTQFAAGGIVEKELPIHVSNVAIADPKTDKPTRVGYEVAKSGDKVRIAKASGEKID